MIKEIQYLRGIACLMVVFTHYKFPYLENLKIKYNNKIK